MVIITQNSHVARFPLLRSPVFVSTSQTPSFPKAKMSQKQIDALAGKIWDYMRLNQRTAPADCILVCGSHDPRVAEYAADLFLGKLAPLIVFSESGGDLPRGGERRRLTGSRELPLKPEFQEGRFLSRERQRIPERISCLRGDFLQNEVSILGGLS